MKNKAELIQKLRSMARAQVVPSQMMRTILAEVPPADQDRQTLVRYMSEAFCFREGQSHSIFGWFPDGSGDLNDSDVDYLLSQKIEQTREEWAAAPSNCRE